MRGLFVDSWAFIALADVRNPRRFMVEAAIERAHADGVALVTTNAVVYECITLIRRRAGHAAATRVLELMTSATQAPVMLHVVRIDEATERATIAIFRHYDDKDFSFVDCLSFAVMRQRGIETALTGDRHFAQMGFRTIPQVLD